MKSDRWELILGDALEGMRELSAGSVDAIMTSPPYADQRVYGEGKRGKTKHGQSRRQRSAAPALAAEWLEPFLEEMLRVCSPAGSLALNLGVVMRDGEESDWADDVLRRARVMGWKLLHRMVWHKPNAIPLSHAAYLHLWGKHRFRNLAVLILAGSVLSYVSSLVLASSATGTPGRRTRRARSGASGSRTWNARMSATAGATPRATSTRTARSQQRCSLLASAAAKASSTRHRWLPNSRGISCR
jgi:hypothetical protein